MLGDVGAGAEEERQGCHRVCVPHWSQLCPPGASQMRSGHWWGWPFSSRLVQNVTWSPTLLFHLFPVPCPAWEYCWVRSASIPVCRAFLRDRTISTIHSLTLPVLVARGHICTKYLRVPPPGGSRTTPLLNSDAITLLGIFRDHHLLLHLSLLPLLLCPPDHSHLPDLIPS